ncbi:MAG: fumarylacetoacetate hydrolase family protein [Armatimonadota bacterium]|nr:fumarylacetoacetate hydrolase family protein [Armatimonadota bacterium]MDR5677008.1 fumarylacetoacetate hydrolase family protein [Armatimonadota bacterium]MDR5689666.1 fumarylacetoacetate hydrolase family protein [Armatimonadota bacterium]MDR7390409.1 fumarylacetoacetate hydrolase family protein [Armatimonadota bacterium]MDR7392688.1 fumarylacetoacetate hydrolase family protein [Armatimonadota bacterium]
MKRVRFAAAGRVRTGEFRDGWLVDEAGRRHRPEEVVWLPPVQPSKVVGLALNYADHAEELGVRVPEEPALFFKPPSSLVGHLAPVVYPSGVRHLHQEVELAVVIGRRCRRVRPEDAYGVVRGYTIANDVTVRDYVGNFYRPPVRAKGYDTFCPVGPWVVEGEVEEPHALRLRAYVNGSLRQEGSTANLLWKIPDLVALVSEIMTLEPDDLILTGTPRGVDPVYPGDVMRLEVEGIGALENPVVSEEPEG